MADQEEVEDNRARLRRFYAYYGQQKTEEDIQKALDKFAGNYPKMWTMIETKYGPESAVNAAPAPAPAASSPAPPASSQQQQPQYHQEEQQDQHQPQQQLQSSPSTTASVNVDAVRDRLRRYYAYYAPSKTEDDVETALATFAEGKRNGGYEAMFAKLEAKYGPEKNIPESASVTLTEDEKVVATKLMLYYQHYGVAKSDTDIKNAIMKFRNASGGFQRMFDKLVEKYGPIPDSVQNASSSSFVGNASGSFATSGSMVAGGGGAGSASNQQQIERQQKEAREAPRLTFEANLEDPAAKLRRFYDCHAPTKTDEEVKQSLSKFIGPTATASGGEQALWGKLADKYGAMPLPPPGYAQQWTRLRKFFNHYNNKGKTSNAEIDWMLAKAHSTPTGVPTLWQDLVAKYGPEPMDPEIERAMRGPFFTAPRVQISSREIGDAGLPPSLSMNQSMPRADGDLFRRPKPKDATGVGECVRLLINFSGFDYPMLEQLPLTKRRAVADAMEQQVALNAGLQARNVALIDYRGSDAEFELSAAAGSEHHLFHAAASLVPRTIQGCFSVKLLRETLLKECQFNPLHVHASAARISKASTANARSSTRAPIVDANASLREAANNPPDAPQLHISEEEARRIKVADEVIRMSELQRMQYSWKKSLEERLAGKVPGGTGSNATALSYKRNNDAFREFMGNIWSETAAAFSKEGTRRSQSNIGGGGNNNNVQDNNKSNVPKNPIPTR